MCNSCGEFLKNGQPSENMLRHVIKCENISVINKQRWIKMEREIRIRKKSALLTPESATKRSTTSTPNNSVRKQLQFSSTKKTNKNNSI